MAKTSKDCSKLDASIAKLAYALAKHPDIKTFEDVVKRIIKMAGDTLLSRQDIVDAVVSFQNSRKTPIRAMLKKAAEILRVPSMQKGLEKDIVDAAKRLEDGATKTPKERRRIADDVLRILREKKKELGSREHDAERIRKLEKEIDTGERDIKARKEKPEPTTPEGKRRAELEAEVATLRRKKNKDVNDARRIARLEDEIATGNFSSVPPKHTAKTEAESRIQDLQRQKREAKSDKARVERLTVEIDAVQKQLESGVFDPTLEKKATVRNELEQRIADLRQEIAQRKRENKKSERQQAEIEDLKQQLTTGKFKESLGPKSTVRTEAEQEIADLRSEIASQKKDNRKSEREQARIAQLEEQLRTGVFPEPKAPVQTARTEAEQRIRNLEQEVASERRAGRNAERQDSEIAALKEQIVTGKFPEAKGKREGPITEREVEIKALREQRDLLENKEDVRSRIEELVEMLESGGLLPEAKGRAPVLRRGAPPTRGRARRASKQDQSEDRSAKADDVGSQTTCDDGHSEHAATRR